jgi:MoxR-like ATPase
VEFEGTFPLPEAQKDRFFLSLRMGYPAPEAEEEVMTAQAHIAHPVTGLKAVSDPATLQTMQELVLPVPVDSAVEKYILDIVTATRVDTRLALGASPRASMALYRGSQALALLRGGDRARAADVRSLAPSVLLKRLSVKPEHQLRGLTEEKVIDDILSGVPQPEEAART